MLLLFLFSFLSGLDGILRSFLHSVTHVAFATIFIVIVILVHILHFDGVMIIISYSVRRSFAEPALGILSHSLASIYLVRGTLNIRIYRHNRHG